VYGEKQPNNFNRQAVAAAELHPYTVTGDESPTYFRSHRMRCKNVQSQW